MKIILLLVLFGFLCFFLGAGFTFYIKAFTKKNKKNKKSSKNEKQKKVDQINPRNVVLNQSSHTKDPRIMVPLQAAKERWQEKPLEKLELKDPGGKVLRGDLWFSDGPSPEKNPFAVIVHGSADSAPGMAYLAEEYHNLGFNVLLVNLRSHGESDGRLIGMGYRESADIVNWIILLKERFGKDIKVLLHGVSMGGAVVLNTLCRENFYVYGLENNVALAVSDCGFGSFKRELKYLFSDIFGKNIVQTFFANIILAGISFWSWFCGNGTLGQNNPCKNLKKLSSMENFKTGIIIFHGNKDNLVNCSEARKIYDSVSENVYKKVVIIEGAPHIGSYFYDRDLYMDEINKGLKATGLK